MKLQIYEAVTSLVHNHVERT